MPEDLNPYLQPGATVQSTDNSVVAFTHRAIGTETNTIEQIRRLYFAVRDSIRYDPYQIDLSVEGLSARRTLDEGHGWCVSKAILLAAGCRVIGVPASLGYADVKNHLSTEKLRQRMKSDIFYWHGYTLIHINGCWLKATPAFNLELCEKFNIKPLDFNGREDSIYHPFDLEGNRHMEYINERGHYAEPPIEEIRSTFESEYSDLVTEARAIKADFDADAEQENRA